MPFWAKAELACPAEIFAGQQNYLVLKFEKRPGFL
jgi:hypothetical protein